MSNSNRLIYNSPAKDFNEALPIGNGRIGGMIYGGTEKDLINLNEDSIWSGGLRNRVNPDSKEGLEEVRKLLFEGRISEAEQTAMDKMAGVNPNSRHYMPLGNLNIEFRHKNSETPKSEDESNSSDTTGSSDTPSDYLRTLDISEATASVSYTLYGAKYTREYFVSAPDNALIVHIKASEKGCISFDAEIDGRDDYYDNNRPISDGMILFNGGTGSNDGIFFAAVLTASCKGGKMRTVGGKVRVENADEATIFLTARTSFYENENEKTNGLKDTNEDESGFVKKAISDAQYALKKDYISLKENHIKDYKKFYDRVSLNIAEYDEKSCSEHGAKSDAESRENITIDERIKNPENDNSLMELYFNFGRYLMISGSRPGTQPLNLQGIWNKDMWPAWGSKFTVNINAEMNYWPAEKCNLPECHLPLFDLLERVRKNGHKMAEEMYGISKGYVCHHNTDIWGDCAPQDKWIPATIWPMGGAWLALHVFEHYEYTNDIDFLKENYRLIKEAAEFFTEYLIEDEKKRPVTCPSVSPENTYLTENGGKGCMCIGPSMDSQILNVLFTDQIKCSELLGIDKDLAEELKAILERLPKPEIGKYGQIKEWAEDYDEVEIGHRHISQLFALHPADLITPNKTPDLAKAARATLDRRLSHGGGHTGWSRAWIANMWARLYDGEKVYENLIKLLQNSTNPNMFDNHPPFQIDGNFGGTAAIVEALLQCTGGEIVLLPALPKRWKEGSVKGFRVKGGAVLNMTWKDGKLASAELISDSDKEFIVRYGETVFNIKAEKGKIAFIV